MSNVARAYASGVIENIQTTNPVDDRVKYAMTLRNNFYDFERKSAASQTFRVKGAMRSQMTQYVKVGKNVFVDGRLVSDSKGFLIDAGPFGLELTSSMGAKQQQNNNQGGYQRQNTEPRTEPQPAENSPAFTEEDLPF